MHALRMTHLALAAALLAPVSASARPGLVPADLVHHDTRASAIGLSYSHVFTPVGSGHVASYLTTFTSTTGQVTADFGVHYLRFEDAEDGTLNGFSASSMTVFSKAFGPRFKDGVPRAQLLIAPGLVPTAMVGSAGVDIDAPLLLRLAFAGAPARQLSIVPWAEGGVALGFQGRVNTEAIDDLEEGDLEDPPEGLEDVLGLDLSVHPFARGGLHLEVHLGRVDLRAHVAAGMIRGESTYTWSIMGGGSLMIRWDKVVPSVLPVPEPALQGAEAADEGAPTAGKGSRKVRADAAPEPGVDAEGEGAPAEEAAEAQGPEADADAAEPDAEPDSAQTDADERDAEPDAPEPDAGPDAPEPDAAD